MPPTSVPAAVGPPAGPGVGVKLCSGARKPGPESPVGVISLCQVIASLIHNINSFARVKASLVHNIDSFAQVKASLVHIIDSFAQVKASLVHNIDSFAQVMASSTQYR